MSKKIYVSENIHTFDCTGLEFKLQLVRLGEEQNYLYNLRLEIKDPNMNDYWESLMSFHKITKEDLLALSENFENLAEKIT